MNLNLSKPICFFDLETTGINISKDRIVEVSVLKILTTLPWRDNKRAKAQVMVVFPWPDDGAEINKAGHKT